MCLRERERERERGGGEGGREGGRGGEKRVIRQRQETQGTLTEILSLVQDSDRPDHPRELLLHGVTASRLLLMKHRGLLLESSSIQLLHQISP